MLDRLAEDLGGRNEHERAIEITYFLLRVVAGLLLMQPGAVRSVGWFGGMPDSASRLQLMSQIWIGGILKSGGFSVLLGLFTRPVAFIFSGKMAVAYWQFHAPKGFWPIQNHGEPAVLLCFIFLYMAARGGGEWSLDALIRRRRGVARLPNWRLRRFREKSFSGLSISPALVRRLSRARVHRRSDRPGRPAPKT